MAPFPVRVFAAALGLLIHGPSLAAKRPNVVLVMADDQGWGQTGYQGHEILKTPHLDEMAKQGLRFERFYAGAPVCSPTRASVLTGRSNERTGVSQHGYALQRQERSLARAMQQAGYATGHFGKWHLNGIRGVGVPLLASDRYHPGHFGFDVWLTVSNFFDLNPLLSRNGVFEDHQGESSEVVVTEALEFIAAQVEAEQPFFTVIWYGSPHSPWQAGEADGGGRGASSLDHHHGELVAMDRSIGKLRAGLRELMVADETLIWYCSDNGGLRRDFGERAVGGLRGGKGDLWEGGIRVPAILEWPAGVKPRLCQLPACTMDIMPTLVDLLDLPGNSMLEPTDGVSLTNRFDESPERRSKPIPFQYRKGAAMIDHDLKIITSQTGGGSYELYDLKQDPKETLDLFAERPEDAERMRVELEAFLTSVEASQAGEDYPEGRITEPAPDGRFWYDLEEYQPFLESWAKRPEYADWVHRGKRSGKPVAR